MIDRVSLTQDWPEPLRQIIVEGCAALADNKTEIASARFEDALLVQPNIPEAHLGLALARRPGPDYRHWLTRLHQVLRPQVYLEIGVESGQTLRLAQAPTVAIGIDPVPAPDAAPHGTDGSAAQTHIHAVTSQAFFASPQSIAEIPGPVELAFIDGDHGFASVLHDFMQVEAVSHPNGVIVLHDTWPLNSLTASPSRKTGFYTGDGWKLLPCLRAIRPDLHSVTIATPPTGLTVVSNLNPASRVLHDRFQAILETFATLPYPRTIAPLLALRANTPDALDHLPAFQAPDVRAIATAKSS